MHGLLVDAGVELQCEPAGGARPEVELALVVSATDLPAARCSAEIRESARGAVRGAVGGPLVRVRFYNFRLSVSLQLFEPLVRLTY